MLPKFACLNNSLNIYNLPIVKQSAPLSLHFPVQLRFFFRMNLCLLRFLSSSRATVKIRSHVLPTDLDTMRLAESLFLPIPNSFPLPTTTTTAAAKRRVLIDYGYIFGTRPNTYTESLQLRAKVAAARSNGVPPNSHRFDYFILRLRRRRCDDDEAGASERGS